MKQIQRKNERRKNWLSINSSSTDSGLENNFKDARMNADTGSAHKNIVISTKIEFQV